MFENYVDISHHLKPGTHGVSSLAKQANQIIPELDSPAPAPD